MENVSEAYTDFGFSLLRACRSSSQGNLFFSPASISIALTMTAHGCKGSSKSQLHSTLKLNNLDDKIILESQKKLSGLNTDDLGTKLSIANALYLDKDYQVIEKYVSDLKTFFLAECKRIDFQHDSTGSVKEINTWIESKTNGMIKDLLSSDAVGPSTAMILVNAIHFKGFWKECFKPEATSLAMFHVSSNNKKEVHMMSMETNLWSTHCPELDCRCLKMAYADGPISCLLLLPNQMDGLFKVEGGISIDILKKINSQLCSNKITLSLPKFKITETIKLKDVLLKIGVQDIFLEGKADLTGISEAKDLLVSDAIHQACIEVNEEGTEAAAATAVMFVTYCMPFTEEYNFDHPFMIIIQNTDTNAVYFVGSIVDI